MSPPGVQLESFADPAALAQAAATAWLNWLTARHADGPAHVALSGGRITGRFFDEIVRQASTRPAQFNAVHFFWADERCVGPDSPDSNFLVARQQLFEPLKIAADHIHRVRGEMEPAAGAALAEQDLRMVLPPNENGQVQLDLVFLGMGEDGHVASLFPGQVESVEQGRLIYRAVSGPKPPPNRVTLTYSALLAAREVWVLASGAGKEAALRESLDPEGRTPLGHVLKARSATRIFSDVRL